MIFSLIAASVTISTASAATSQTVKPCSPWTDSTIPCVQYLSNYDGDTFRARLPIHAPSMFRVVNIRIRGIDAPEIKGQTKCERDAAIHVRDHARALLSAAKRIDLEQISRDKYFRVLARVQITDDNGTYDLAAKLRETDPTETANYDGGKKAIWCGTK